MVPEINLSDEQEIYWFDLVRMLEENLKYLDSKKTAIQDQETEELKEELKQAAKAVEIKYGSNKQQ